MKILLAFNGSRLSEAALRAVITQRRPKCRSTWLGKPCEPQALKQ
jgi:hypothetical protein